MNSFCLLQRVSGHDPLTRGGKICANKRVSDQTFNEPRLALNRIYTKRGDQGETSLAGGQRVSKDDPRIECYGTVDELNACVGMAAVSAADDVRHESLLHILRRVQHELFNLGSILATLPEDVHPRQARITEADVTRLETEIDHMNADLEPLRSFVLPGGTRLNAELHLCRTVARRAERILVTFDRCAGGPPHAVQYLNRLSDAFFVFSRWAAHAVGAEEVLWKPNEPAASG